MRVYFAIKCKLLNCNRFILLWQRKSSTEIAHLGKGKWMTKSSHSSSQTARQLKDWLVKPEVKVRTYLKKPSCFEGMNDYDRRSAELDDRTQAAERIMVQYLDENAEFTAIMNDLCVARGRDGKAVYCSALREALKEIQESDRVAYANSSSHARGRKLEVAA